MKSFYLFIFCFTSSLGFSQEIDVAPNEIIAVADVIQRFEKASTIRFSYDVLTMENTFVAPKATKLTLKSLFKLINRQASITHDLSSKNTYRLLKSSIKIQYCIRVLDRSSTFEIEGATIKINNQTAVLTNERGEVLIETTPGTKAVISYEGRNEETVVLSRKVIGCNRVYLTPDTTTLQEVVLENYLTKGLIQRTNGSLELSTEELGILPGLIEPDIFQSLQLVPGISSPNEDPAALNIRGGTPDQNLILWDGIKMYQTGHFFNQISAFNPYIIDKVSIYKGGTSVQYGDRLSGVIDISSTDNLFKEEFGVGLNLTTLDFYVKTPLTRNLGIMFASRRSVTDIVKSFTFNSLEEKVFQNTVDNLVQDEDEGSNDPFRTSFSDFNFKMVWKPSKYKKLAFSTILVVDEFDNNQFNTPLDEPVVRPATDRIVQSNFGASLTYTDTDPDRATKKLQGYVSSYFSDYTLQSTRQDQVGQVNENFLLERYDYILDLGYDASIKVNVGENDHLLLGQQLSYKRITNTVQEGLIDPDAPFQIGASFIPSVLDVIGYGEYGLKRKKLSITGGLRAGYYNNFETPFMEPRLFSSYKISNSTRITASLERKNQSISQLYAPQQEPRLFQLVPLVNLYWSEQRFENEKVRLLRSDQTTLGLIHNSSGWTIEAEGYYKKIKGLSPFTSDLLTQILVLQERTDVPLGESTRYGFDLLVKKRWNAYRAWAGISLAQNKTTFKDFQSNSFTPPIDQEIRVNLSQTYTFKTLELGLGWTYGSGLSFTPLDTGSIQNIDTVLSNNQLYTDRLNSYHRLDLSIFNNFKKIKNWRGKLGFAIRNTYARNKPLQPFNTLYNLDNETAIRTNTTNSLGLTADIVLRITWD